MAEIVLLNKPFNVLCQFSDSAGRQTLADFIGSGIGEDFYPAGRLDRDSEGLVLLTNDGALQHRISHPRHKLPKTYWAQLEGEIDERALQNLRDGVILNDGKTAPANVNKIAPPPVWPRDPPIRERENIPTSWIELTITEGRNRQVRRMTAAVGFPTLRLIRQSIGQWRLDGLAPGNFRSDTVHLPNASPKRKPNLKPKTTPTTTPTTKSKHKKEKP